MKNKLICLVIGLLLIAGAYNAYADVFYNYGDIKIQLKQVPNKYYLQTDKDFDVSKFESVKNVVKEPQAVTIPASIKRFNKNDVEFGYWSTIVSDADISVLEKMDGVKYVAPVFLTEVKQEATLSNFIYIRLKSVGDIAILKELSDKYSFYIVGNMESMPLWFALSCDKNSAGNALQVANILFETGKFIAVEPDLMTDDANCVNDTYFVSGQQWNLNGTYGINYCGARTITRGANTVSAVLDQGIERGHPDISNLHPLSFDLENMASPSQIRGSHGTAVAGIIGATTNNGTGVASIAPNSRLMDISTTLAGTPLNRMRRADGLNWAWRNGADVINNSWGSSVAYTVIDEAIDSALQRGRSGRGTVVVFAAGNDYNSTVAYPANSRSDILAVGAIMSSGQRASYSNYGTALDVVAPADPVTTTDLTGSAGYDPTDYTSVFNGTSSAAPHVAGIAALVLSVNPTLTQRQVANIIESTAREVRTDLYTYSNTAGRPNGTWNNQMGYGLVNAYSAVRQTLCGTSTATVTGTINGDRTVYGNVINTSSTTTVQSGTTTLTACNNVNINNGFTVQRGAVLNIVANR